MNTHRLPTVTMLLLISFASVNAVLFTPALPNIATFFAVSEAMTQYTISWFLIGYALGQLIYGPLANRFGRKKALYAGIALQIVSSFLCVFSGYIQTFELLIMGRFFLALGSGVGLTMTFTLINECYEPQIASQKITMLLLAFAITPALGIALGGFLTTHYHWQSCFYAGAMYGIILWVLVYRLPETKIIVDKNAFQWKNLLKNYGKQFKSKPLLIGGLLMGLSTSFIYVFSAMAPFIAITLNNMKINDYGLANLIPPIGLIGGSLTSAWLAKKYSLSNLIAVGIVISLVGSLIMYLTCTMTVSIYVWMFSSITLIYFGLCFVISNSSTFALAQTEDKAYGSAVMNFINMGCATVMVLMLGLFSIKAILLPIVFIGFASLMLVMLPFAFKK